MDLGCSGWNGAAGFCAPKKFLRLCSLTHPSKTLEELSVGSHHGACFHGEVAQVKSQGLLFSEAKKPHAEAVGQTGAQGLVRGCGPHCPPVSRKNPARDEASGAPRAGRGSASFSSLAESFRGTGGLGTTPAHQPLRASLAHCLCTWLFCLRKKS